MKKNLFPLALLLIASTTFIGCDTNDPTDPTIRVTNVSLNRNTLTLFVGGTESLEHTITPGDATNQNVEWTSSNDAVATVDNGLVRARAAGTATVTVTTECGNRTATAAVTVTDEPPPIVMEDEEEAEQTLYADEEASESGINFTTTAPWTSSITEVPTAPTATAATRNTAPAWISISPEYGGAGTHTIQIALETNSTGEDRTAIITISSGGMNITITVTQQGVTEDGEVPDPPAPPAETVTEIRAENIVGDFSDVATVKLLGWCPITDEDIVIAEAPFVNNGFTLQLPETVPDNLLELISEWFDDFDDIVISDRNARTVIVDNVAAFDSNGDRIAGFYLACEIGEPEWHHILWIFADKDVTVRGRSSEHESGYGYDEFDLYLRKGWNIVYLYEYWDSNTETGRNVATTRKPADVNFRWGRQDWLDPNPPTPENPFSPEFIEAFMNSLRGSVQEVQNLYYELDTQFSTYESRQWQYLTPQTPVVFQFWSGAYRAIRQNNVFLDNFERMEASETNTNFKGEVLANRALMYFYLKTMFGGVPLVATAEIDFDFFPSRATWSETADFIRSDIQQAIPLLASRERIAECLRVLALIAFQEQDYAQANNHLQQSIEQLSNIHIPTYLLSAEALLRIGQNVQAIERVNQVLQSIEKELLPPYATSNEVLDAIKGIFINRNSGLKFLNAVRWGETQSWGHLQLLPIPLSELIVNPNMVQNPGW